MNKAELVEALAQHYDGSKAEASRALNAVVQTITRSTAAGEKVAITGFGVFEKVERPARMVRNPRTGERKEAPATAVPRFRAGTELKAYVSGQRELPEPSVEAAAPVARPTRTRRPAAAPAEQAPIPEPVATPEAPAARKSTKKSSAADAKANAKPAGKSGKKSDAKKSDKKAEAKKSDKKSAAKKADGKKSSKKK